jgi:hypothetical protein
MKKSNNINIVIREKGNQKNKGNQKKGLIEREIISYSQGVVTLMCIFLDLGRIWPDEVYTDGVYDHTKPSRIVCMSSIQVYIEYMVILILYSTAVVF